MIEPRNIGLSILFSIITCGLYSMYWFVKLTDESNELSGEIGTSGGTALLLTIVTCGIYRLFWNYKIGKIMERAQERAGVRATDNSVLYLVLALLGLDIITFAIVQSDINDMV